MWDDHSQPDLAVDGIRVLVHGCAIRNKAAAEVVRDIADAEAERTIFQARKSKRDTVSVPEVGKEPFHR